MTQLGHWDGWVQLSLLIPSSYYKGQGGPQGEGTAWWAILILRKEKNARQALRLAGRAGLAAILSLEICRVCWLVEPSVCVYLWGVSFLGAVGTGPHTSLSDSRPWHTRGLSMFLHWAGSCGHSNMSCPGSHCFTIWFFFNSPRLGWGCWELSQGRFWGGKEVTEVLLLLLVIFVLWMEDVKTDGDDKSLCVCTHTDTHTTARVRSCVTFSSFLLDPLLTPLVT